MFSRAVLVWSTRMGSGLWARRGDVVLWLLRDEPGLPALAGARSRWRVIAGIAERQSVRLFTHRGTNLDMSVAFLPFVVHRGRLRATRSVHRWGPRQPQRLSPSLPAVGGLHTDSRTDGRCSGLARLASIPAAVSLQFSSILLQPLTRRGRKSGVRRRSHPRDGSWYAATSPLMYVRAMVLALLRGACLSMCQRWPFSSMATRSIHWPRSVHSSCQSLALQRVVHLYQEQREATDRLGEANARLARANLSFASALVATLDARDRYTAGHSAAVAIYSRDIAKRLGLDEEQQQRCYVTGLVHDIGKIGLPAGLLEKPGALTLEERRQMQEHSAIGERILAKSRHLPRDSAQIVRHHHERVDGTGYPRWADGADDIPLLSRIIAVADAYNAMTSDRPYRDAMPSRVARLRLAQAVESQFDTSVVAAFEAILAGADESYRMGKRDDFQIMDARRSFRLLRRRPLSASMMRYAQRRGRS